MPVLKSTTNYKTRAGKRRTIRLFKAWKNMRGRVAGTNYAGNKKRVWMGLPIHFQNWHHFRNWSLENGFSKINNSLDRKEEDQGYSPSNCRWVPVSANTAYENIKRGIKGRGRGYMTDSLRRARENSAPWHAKT